MNKTKVIATIGPMTYKSGVLEDMITSGTDVIRLNMSFSDYGFCRKVIDDINEINNRLNLTTATMLDLAGPCIRTGNFPNDRTYFKKGDCIRMYMNKMMGSEVEFSINYPDLIKDLKYRSVIKLNNGKVVLEVVEIGLDYAVLEVLQGGQVTSQSKVHLPYIKVNHQFLTEQDREDILFANEMGIDFLGVSNVEDADDVLEINDLLISLKNDHIELIAKIQNDKAVRELEKIIEVADGVLLSRSDVAIETPIEEVPNIQDKLVKLCHRYGKVSIISAELDSFLTKEIIPSRSEVSDIANIVSDSADAILLAGETTVGIHPVEAIIEIEKIISSSEKQADYHYFFNKALETKTNDIAGIIASSAALGASELDCKAIIIATNSGYTARQMSRFRPPCLIIAAAPNKEVAKSMNLHFGVVPVVVAEFNFDTISAKSTLITQRLLKLEPGDKVIVTGGYPYEDIKHTNFMKIDVL